MELTEHKKRLLTAAVAVPILLAIFIWGGEVMFTCLIVAVGVVATYEYHRIVGLSASWRGFDFLWAATLTAAIVAAAHFGSIATIFFLLWCALFIFAARAMYLYSRDRASFELLAADLLGILYIPCLVASLVLLRKDSFLGQDVDGRVWIFTTVALAFFADTGAYYAGRTFGKHKLAPKISPGKTVEGAVGGICANMLMAWLCAHFLLGGFPLAAALAMGVLAAVFGMMGDLFESMIKRTFGIKDSGSILPGHGGILDRIDALLFASPVVFCFKYFYA